ncbi:ParA family protein [Burkholderiaceae bacterium DAT-1]|nr:ParA family protein [Burkholderiaceae bacterium DAT-1]
MSLILVANPKGGAGKSTLSTNLATWFAWQQQNVALADLDRQQSAARWLQLRPIQFPAIQPWDIDEDNLPDAPPSDCDVGIIDSPAGLRGKRLDALLRVVDRIVVPVQASLFDMSASEDFFARLAEEKRVRKGKVKVAAVGMRVKEGTRAAQELVGFLDRFDLPVLGYLRDTQYYVQTLPRGLGIFDLPASRTGKDVEQWRDILEWMK